MDTENKALEQLLGILKVPNDAFEFIVSLLSLNVNKVKMDHVISIILKKNIERLLLAGVKARWM